MPRKSRIQQYPPEIRAEIDRLLVSRGFAGYDWATEELAERGIPVSRTALHRYGQQLESRLAAIRDSTEAAKMIAEIAPDAADHRSAAVMSILQSHLFDLLLAVESSKKEGEDGASPEERITLLSKAARAIADLARSSISQKKHESSVREEERKTAAEVATRVARQGGLSVESVQELRRAILGMGPE